MKNRIIILSVVLMAAAAVMLFAQQFDAESDFNVVRSNDGSFVIITGYAGSNKIVSIPPVIRQLPVKVIWDGAFKGKKLTGVTIPDSVTNIGPEAFANNKLTGIAIPDSVTNIGQSAFRRNKLIEITIGSGVTHIGESAFSRNRITGVTIPGSVTIIESHAFWKNKITSVTIGGNVTIREGKFLPAFDNGFGQFYIDAGRRRAGTYIFRNGSWGEDW